MLIDFNKIQEIVMPCMNNGTGEMTVRMYNDENYRIIPTVIHKGGSIGIHTQSSGDDLNYILSGTGKAICCYSPPILSTNRHRILSFRHWLCQAIGILFCQRNEIALEENKSDKPNNKPRIQTDSGIIRIRIGMMPSLQFYEKVV